MTKAMYTNLTDSLDEINQFLLRYTFTTTIKQAIKLKYEANILTHLTKEDIWMVNKHIKRCSSSYVIREMNIDTTNR